MNLHTIIQQIKTNMASHSREFLRLFHGRGGCFESWEHLTVDSIDTIFYACFYEQKSNEQEVIDALKEVALEKNYQTVIIQRRYLANAPCEVIHGSLDEQSVLIENGLSYAINFNNQNIGFFADMKKGHEYVQQNSKDKNVLNLFSYTCAFSVCAIEGGATKAVNVDMSKSALSTGRTNHRLNNHDTKKVKFMPYNILKSWSRIKKEGPYDLIIIDPPSFQKGSFAATKDYEKIIKRLGELSSDTCTVFSALNAPELDENFIKALFKEHASEFEFQERLDNDESFKAKEEQRSLKNMIFVKKA